MPNFASPTPLDELTLAGLAVGTVAYFLLIRRRARMRWLRSRLSDAVPSIRLWVAQRQAAQR